MSAAGVLVRGMGGGEAARGLGGPEVSPALVKALLSPGPEQADKDGAGWGRESSPPGRSSQ